MNIINIIAELKHSQVFQYVPERAVVKLEGPDAKSFLQRMSTNDMSKLAPGHLVQTCFLNNKGRLVDYVIVIEAGPESYLLLSSFFDGTKLCDWLSNFHFVEDMQIRQSSNTVTLLISAPETKGDEDALVWSAHDFNIFLDLKSPDYPVINKHNWECLRIAALMPEAPQEINEAFMPQNIGLAYLIADNKGCYLGQEVIAKALTYQKNVKSLAGVKLSLEDFARAQVGDRVADSARSGVLTSLAPAYVPGIANALAVLDCKDRESENLAAEFILKKFA